MPNIDITSDQYRLINDILDQFLEEKIQVWVFGSRSTFKARKGSDLDLAITSDQAIDTCQLAQLKQAFCEARLPFRVDLMDMSCVSELFKAVIEKEKVLFERGMGRRVGWV